MKKKDENQLNIIFNNENYIDGINLCNFINKKFEYFHNSNINYIKKISK
jgi:hypothetical protein